MKLALDSLNYEKGIDPEKVKENLQETDDGKKRKASLDKYYEYCGDEYKESVLPVEIRKIVVEASSSFSWNRLVYNSKYLITLDEFGASGPASEVHKKFGFDSESLEEKIDNLLK